MTTPMLHVHGFPRPAWVMPMLFAWALAAVLLAASGGFQWDVGPVPLGVVLGLGLPVLVYLLLMRFSPGFRNWVDKLDFALLVSLHAWRTVGLAFLVAAWFGHLHATFAWPAGLGDALVAVWATWLAHRMRGAGGHVSRQELKAWNLTGLADFALAVVLGLLLRPELGLAGPPGTSAMGQFPLALFPGFVVPFFVITHLVLSRRLRATRPAQARRVDF